MLESYEPKNYTVITKGLLVSLANRQQTKRPRKRTLDNIDEIRLEYLNILKIDCLWPLTNLVKLKLNNNAIEKIENLDSLHNLCELDLSFNRIKKIENLDALTNVHVLSFYANEIEIIENIDHMLNLTIFSIGKNNVQDWDHVLYLRDFKELRSVQMTGNPCTEATGYYSYLIAFVPQLVYYGYKMINEKDRNESNEKHNRAIANIMESEAKKEKELQIKKEAEEKEAQLSVSYVEYLNEDCLFLQMFIDDEDGRNLSQVNDETSAMYEQYRQSFSAVCHQLYELGLKEELKRREEINAITSVIDDVNGKITCKARALMDSVQGKRLEITVRVTQMLREAAIAAADDVDLDDDSIDEIDKVARELSREFHAYVGVIKAKLMREETVVDEQIEEMIRMFKMNIGEMVSAFLETAQESFTQLRNLETEFNENLLPVVMTYVNALEDEEKTPFLLALTEDKDGLTNSLASSHFAHLKVIDDRQDRMMTRLKEWQTQFVDNLVEQNTRTRRSRVLEITHFLDYHLENSTVAKLLGQQTLQMEEAEEEEDYEETYEGGAENKTESSDED